MLAELACLPSKSYPTTTEGYPNIDGASEKSRKMQTHRTGSVKVSFEGACRELCIDPHVATSIEC
jgi:hypothetical protein